jgi:sorting nexin-29
MRNAVKESVKITCCSKQKFLKNYKELWTETTHEETEWGTDNEDEQEITLEELELALEKIKCGKSPGEDQINSELYKYAGNNFHNRFLQFFNMVYLSKAIPNGWRRSIIVPVLKKGDKRNPENYRGISLLNTYCKIYSRLLNEKLKKFTEQFLLECQNVFRKGRSCTDSIFTLKLLIEKRTEFNLETHIAFLHFEKAFVSVKRHTLFEILQEKKHS